MFRISPKRSVMTVAVVAGLLAAAGPAGASNAGNDGARAVGFMGEGHEVAVEGFMDYTDDALWFSGDAYVNEMGVTAAGDDVLPVASGEPPQGAYTSLGRENSIECLLRAKASDEGQTQSPKSAPLTITLCHEGFEIQ
jgi:hypothetical protein